MHRTSSTPPHRQSRREQRRQKMRRRAWMVVVSIIGICAFGAGFLWRQSKAKTAIAEPTTQQSTPPQRAQAIELLDSAVAARHGELTNEAVRLALDARGLDPAVPGAALFLAEMSLRAGDAEGVNAAARQALDQETYAANAKLLLAMSIRMLRGPASTDDAGRSSTELLAEASEAELANNQTRFFAGDALRAIGRPAEAQANLLGSLRRQQPWHSSPVLIAKLWLALHEAGPQAQAGAALAATGSEGEIYGATAVQMLRAIREQRDAVQFLGALQSVYTAKQVADLSVDPSLAGSVMDAARPVGEKLSLPFVRPAVSVGQEGALQGEAWKQRGNALDAKHFQLPGGLRSEK